MDINNIKEEHDRKSVVCNTCKGEKYGYDDETGIETCPTCGGTGVIEIENKKE